MEYSKQTVIDGLKRTIEQMEARIVELSELCVKSLAFSRDERFSRIEGSWLSEGVNHKTSKGRIQREFPNGAEGHFIEINSIEELLEFQKKVGNELIITSAIDNESIPAIEIYNNYRE